MKILIIIESPYDGFQCNSVCFVVPDDFPCLSNNDACPEFMNKLRNEWIAETWVSRIRLGKPTKRKHETIEFTDWLAGRFERVDFVEG